MTTRKLLTTGDVDDREQRLLSLAEQRGYVLACSGAKDDQVGLGDWFIFDLSDNTFVTLGEGMTLDEAEDYIEEASG